MDTGARLGAPRRDGDERFILDWRFMFTQRGCMQGIQGKQKTGVDLRRLESERIICSSIRPAKLGSEQPRPPPVEEGERSLWVRLVPSL
jgi:hypothetical protein